jgi:hypothetical protein
MGGAERRRAAAPIPRAGRPPTPPAGVPVGRRCGDSAAGGQRPMLLQSPARPCGCAAGGSRTARMCGCAARLRGGGRRRVGGASVALRRGGGGGAARRLGWEKERAGEGPLSSSRLERGCGGAAGRRVGCATAAPFSPDGGHRWQDVLLPGYCGWAARAAAAWGAERRRRPPSSSFLAIHVAAGRMRLARLISTCAEHRSHPFSIAPAQCSQPSNWAEDSVKKGKLGNLASKCCRACIKLHGEENLGRIAWRSSK